MPTNIAAKLVVCIDPGITSVGLFAGVLTEAAAVASIRLCVAVNMMECKAEFGRPKHVHTYICNFFGAYAELLTEAAVLVVERQPPQSAGLAVEVMLRERYGAKCVFIHPASIHARFGSAGYTYDGRKARSVAISVQFLEHVAELPGAAAALDVLAGMERKHDCTDACLMFIMYCEAAAKSASAAASAALKPDPPTPVKSAYFQEAPAESVVPSVKSAYLEEAPAEPDFVAFLEQFRHVRTPPPAPAPPDFATFLEGFRYVPPRVP